MQIFFPIGILYLFNHATTLRRHFYLAAFYILHWLFPMLLTLTRVHFCSS